MASTCSCGTPWPSPPKHCLTAYSCYMFRHQRHTQLCGEGTTLLIMQNCCTHYYKVQGVPKVSARQALGVGEVVRRFKTTPFPWGKEISQCLPSHPQIQCRNPLHRLIPRAQGPGRWEEPAQNWVRPAGSFPASVHPQKVAASPPTFPQKPRPTPPTKWIKNNDQQ